MPEINLKSSEIKETIRKHRNQSTKSVCSSLVKNDNLINGENKIELLECIEKTNANRNNHENERSRINLKWTVLTECRIWY